MVDLKAKKLRRYRGRALKPGGRFTVTSQSQARVLVATGLAEPDLGEYSAPVPMTETKYHPLDRDRRDGPGGSLPNSPPSLNGKIKVELLAIAADENVEADKTMRNSDIIAAIEAKRANASEE